MSGRSEVPFGLLDGVDGPRPLPDSLRERLEAALLDGTARALLGADDPRQLPDALDARLEASLLAAGRGAPLPKVLRGRLERALLGAAPTDRRIRLLAAAAVLLIVVATTAVVAHSGEGHSDPPVSQARPPLTTPESTTTTAARRPRPSEPAQPAPARSAPGTRPVDVVAASLRPFQACDDLLSHVREKALEVVGPSGIPYQGAEGVPGSSIGGGAGAGAEAAPAAPPPESSEPGQPAVSEGTAMGGSVATNGSVTNVQEAGVDEPDIVKSNGERLLVLEGRTLHHLDVREGGLRYGATLTLEGGDPLEVLLAGDRAIVLGYAQPGTTRFTTTVVWIVDLSQSGAMRVVKTMRFDADYISARQVDGVARLVLVADKRPLYITPPDNSPAAQEAAAAENRRITASSQTSDWLPMYWSEERHADGTVTTASGQLCSCDLTLHPDEFSGFRTLTVLTIDPADPQPDAAAAVLADGHHLYGSTDSLYVATTGWAMQPADSPRGSEIHKFDIRDPRGATYRASGEVPGYIIGQWAFSEHEGLLRVASTVADSSGTDSRITVLADRGTELAEVGHVGGLGPGEQIQAVRYFGDTAFVVTFRQTDPLYSVDLSDPAHPSVLGELKIPGFSGYLHPVGDRRLVGVGVDGEDPAGWFGVQASLFDVADLRHPERLDLWPPEKPKHWDSTFSPAVRDHRAFTFSPAASLAVIPVSRSVGEGERPRYVGDAAVLWIRGRELDQVAWLTHEGRSERDNKADAGIDRSFVVDGSLYTVSARGVLASQLSDLSDRAWVPLP